MKKLLLAAIFGAVSAVPALAQFDGAAPKAGARQAPSVSAPALESGNLPTRAAKPKEWTVMVFINGKNDLEIAGLLNVNQMEKVGSGKDINIVVEHGRIAGHTDLDGDWTGSRRMLVTKDNDENKITSRVLMETRTVDMGDYKRVVDFMKWTKRKFPAKRYVLIIWNHGTGWMDPRKDDGKGILFDDETGNYVRTPQIGKILKEAYPVDILAFDACLMQMTEVAYEVKDYAKVIVGSEETIPGMGYPYDLFLGAMARKPEMKTEETGAIMVEAFRMFYDAYKKNTTLSAIRTSKLEGLGKKMMDFAKISREVGDMNALAVARAGVIRYDAVGPSDDKMTISFYGDVAQFARIAAHSLKEHPKAADMKAKAEALAKYIEKDLVIYRGSTGKNRAGHEMRESRGISVYLPPAETRIPQAKLEGIFEAPYTTFAFDKAVKWHDFVTFLYGAKLASRCVDPGEGATMEQIAEYAACKTDEELGLN